MPRLVNWSTSRASSVVSSHGCSAAAPPPSAAEVATSTALEPGATGERRRPATGRRRGPVSVTALFTARQGIRGAQPERTRSSSNATQSAPTVSGS